MPATSDETWDAIAAAAYPVTLDSEARDALDQCLRDYRGLQRDPRRILTMRDLWRKQAQHLKAAGEVASEISKLSRSFIDCDSIREMQERAEAIADGLAMAARVRQGKQDPAREWLYWRLFGIWTSVGGELVCSTPPKGGKPYGPLISFVATVFERALHEQVSPHTIRNAIKRERQRRGLGSI